MKDHMEFSRFKAWLEFKTGFKFAEDLDIEKICDGEQSSSFDVKMDFIDNSSMTTCSGLSFTANEVLSQDEAKRTYVKKFFAKELEAWKRPEIMQSEGMLHGRQIGNSIRNLSYLMKIILDYSKIYEAMECSESQAELELALRGI